MAARRHRCARSALRGLRVHLCRQLYAHASIMHHCTQLSIAADGSALPCTGLQTPPSHARAGVRSYASDAEFFFRQHQVTEAVLEANTGLADNGPILPAGIRITLPEVAAPAMTQGVKLWD